VTLYSEAKLESRAEGIGGHFPQKVPMKAFLGSGGSSFVVVDVVLVEFETFYKL
jgi:hypothetical protein